MQPSCLLSPARNNALCLVLLDESPLKSLEATTCPCQHISVPEKHLCSAPTDDHFGVLGGTHMQGHAVGQVGLDATGHDLDLWPLCGHDQMQPGGAPELSEVAEILFHFLRGDHQRVPQLVDDEQQFRKVFERGIA